MKERTFWLLALMLVLGLAIGLVVACGGSSSSGGGGKSAGDDDASGDDDSASGDTWTDSSSGLTWQVTPPTDYMVWADAKTYCQNLAGGGWRLPTISELRTLIRGCPATQTGGACGVTDSCLNYSSCWSDPCQGCSAGAGPDNGNYGPSQLAGDGDWYWSSSAVAGYVVVSYAWGVDFYDGFVGGPDTYGGNHVRCVR